MDMPRPLGELKAVEKSLNAIDEWSNPQRRGSTSFTDPVPPSPGRHSTLRPIDTSNRETSFRKTKQRFTHLFRSLFRLLQDPDEEMNAATVDRGKNMFQNLTNLRQSLDKCDDEDQDTVQIDAVLYRP